MQVNPTPLEWPENLKPVAKSTKPNFGQRVQEVISAVAPTLGTVLGGPLGGLAGVILARVFGTTDTSTIEAQIAAQSPEALLKLREAEAQLQIELRKLDIDEERLNVEDRTSARQLAVAKGIWPQVSLSVLYTCGYFAALALFVTGRIAPPPGYAETITLLVGMLSSAQLMILTYWFGSSSGSQRKSDVIAAIAKEP